MKDSKKIYHAPLDVLKDLCGFPKFDLDVSKDANVAMDDPKKHEFLKIPKKGGNNNLNLQFHKDKDHIEDNPQKNSLGEIEALGAQKPNQCSLQLETQNLNFEYVIYVTTS